MTQFKHFILSVAVGLAVLTALMWSAIWQNISLEKVEVSYDSISYQSVQLPFTTDHIGTYSIRIGLRGAVSDGHLVRIFPDDEIIALSVNGTPVGLDNISESERRDYSSGFLIALPNLRADQTNVLEAQLINASNPAGFRIESSHRLNKLTMGAVFGILVFFSFFLVTKLKISKSQSLLLLLSLAISIIYLSKTNERTRTFDVFEGGGHRDYIEYLIEHKKLPPPGDGWEYHQPPLYYLTAALAKQFAPIDSKIAGDLWGQLLALFFWTLFLCSGLATLKIVFRKHKVALLLASLALCLWPAGIIHSIRIGNDVALYAFYGLTFFYTVKWWRTRRSAPLFWASIWMAASLLTKSNGLAVAGVLGVLFLFHGYNLVRKRNRFALQKAKLLRDLSIVGGLFLFAVLLNFGDNLLHYLDGTSKDWLLSNVSEMINPGLKVNNELKNYLLFDLATFLQYPFISTWEDTYGRQYFWNFVWRSALTSEFFFEDTAMSLWGVINGVLLLAVLMGTVIYYLQLQPIRSRQDIKRHAYRHLPWLLALIFPFVLLLAYRIKVPLSCNTDFRYIYPVLIPMIFFATQIWRRPTNLPIPALLLISLPLIGLNTLFWIYELYQQ